MNEEEERKIGDTLRSEEANRALFDLIREALAQNLGGPVWLELHKQSNTFTAHRGRVTVEGEYDPLTAEIDWDATSVITHVKKI